MAEVWERKAFERQALYLKDIAAWDFETQHSITQQLVDDLEAIRQDTKAQIKETHKIVKRLDTNEITTDAFIEKFVTNIKEISINCSDKIVSFAKKVFMLSVDRFGSLAKGETTPYSDLEYLFLIQHKSPEIVAYFEKLAVSGYFIIGNLKETELGYMSIAELKGWFEDKQKSGFKIDGLKEGAGNIPTGNGSSSQLNHLILTPAELIQKYREVLDNPNEDAVRGDFTAKLQFTKLLYFNGEGAEHFLDQFVEEKNRLPLTEARQKANRNMFFADSKKYGFRPTEHTISNGFSINTKKDLYRYPSILLYNILIIFNLSQTNSWQSLDCLIQNNYISSSVHKSILFLLSCACYLRLSTYTFYDSAENRLSVLPINLFSHSKNRPFFQPECDSGKRWFLSQKLFNLHCEYLVPLKKHISACQVESIEFLLKEQVQQVNWLVKFQIFHSCNRWSKSQGLLQKHINTKHLLEQPEQTISTIYSMVNHSFDELWNCVKALTYSLCQERKYKEALAYHLHIQNMAKSGAELEDYQERNLVLAESKTESGSCYYGLTDYTSALKEFMLSLQIQNTLLSNNYEHLAKTHHRIGKSYNMMFEYQKARDHLFEALQICFNETSKEVEFNYYGEVIYTEETDHSLVNLREKSPEEKLKYLNNSSIILAHILWALGLNYMFTKYYNLAFLYFDKSREMFYERYGSEACHKDISQLLYALGSISTLLGRHAQTEEYFHGGLSMAIQAFGKNKGLPSAALHCLAKIDLKKYHKLVVKIFFELPRFKVAHSQSATVASRYGLHLLYIGEHSLAEKTLKLSLETYRKSADEGNCHFPYGYVSNTLSHLALNYWKSGNIEQAKAYYRESLELLVHVDRATPKSADLERGEILQMMGCMYESLHHYDKALECFQESERKFLTACDDDNHPKICEVQRHIQSISEKIESQANNNCS